MKNTFLKTIGGAALTILMLTMFAQVRVSAQDTNNEDQSKEQTQEDLSGRRGNNTKLEGTWDMEVTTRNCQTGAATRTFASIDTFMSGGTMLNSTSGFPQALVTPEQGVWSQVGGNTYRFKFKSFSFDASGNFIGWTIIVSYEANLNRRADRYNAVGTAEVYAPNGNLLFTGCSTATATRFE
jgi:hypothetical protein